MDKLAYHLNKKKKPAETQGKFLYYYPCDAADSPNAHIGGKDYIVIEVSESEWEALIEMDRFEYNNLHKLQRHSTPIPTDEEMLPLKEQERLINRDEPFTESVHDDMDKQAIFEKFAKQESLADEKFEAYLLCEEHDMTQAQATEELGVTQGAVSMMVKGARNKLVETKLKDASPDEYVWICWDMFLDKGEMPNFLDVEIEFVIRGLFCALLPLTHWYYSFGEFCRYIMKFYLIDEDRFEEDIEKYRQTAPRKHITYFEENFGEKPLIIQAVYVRLCMEIRRRKQAGLSNSDKAYTSVYEVVEKIAKRLKTTVYDFLTQRFYPYFAARRIKRLRQFYKAYTGKKAPF